MMKGWDKFSEDENTLGKAEEYGFKCACVTCPLVPQALLLASVGHYWEGCGTIKTRWEENTGQQVPAEYT